MTKRPDLSIPKRWSSPVCPTFYQRALWRSAKKWSGFFVVFWFQILNKKSGKNHRFLFVQSQISTKMSSSCYWLACFWKPPSKQRSTKRILTNPTTFQRPQEVLFLSEGSPFPPRAPAGLSVSLETFWPLKLAQISIPPWTVEGDAPKWPAFRRSWRTHKKNFENPNVLWFSLFFGSRTIPYW